MSSVIISSARPALRVAAVLDEDPPKLTVGPGWQETARPRQVAFAEWTGTALRRMALPLVLEGWPEDDQEPFIANLLRWCEASPQSGGQPPQVKVAGDGVPCAPEDVWVVETLEFGDVVARRADGHRVRQSLTLGLMEFEAPTIALTRSAAARAAAAAAPAARTVTARQGDTMSKIAARELGKAARWTEIRDLNDDLRTPSRVIKAGTRVKVPAR